MLCYVMLWGSSERGEARRGVYMGKWRESTSSSTLLELYSTLALLYSTLLYSTLRYRYSLKENEMAIAM